MALGGRSAKADKWICRNSEGAVRKAECYQGEARVPLWSSQRLTERIPDPRLFDTNWLTLMSVWGCSTPSTFSYPSRAHRCIASASSYLPCLSNTDPSWLSNLLVCHSTISSVKCDTNNQALLNLVRNGRHSPCLLLRRFGSGCKHRLHGGSRNFHGRSNCFC